MDALLLAVLAVISYTDIRKHRIPDGCCICIAALAVLSGAVSPQPGVAERILGGLCVSVPMCGLAMLRPGSFGGGDIKLMCASGALLGVRQTLCSWAVGILCAGIYALYLLAIKNTGRKAELPLGPFLCLGIAIPIIFLRM